MLTWPKGRRAKIQVALFMDLGHCGKINKGGNMKTETIKKVLELKRADFNLAQYALDKGHSITVDYGMDEDGCTKSKDFNEIKEAADAICDEYHMRIINNENRQVGCAWVVYGNDDHELVADYTANKFMDEWWASYEQAYGDEM